MYNFLYVFLYNFLYNFYAALDATCPMEAKVTSSSKEKLWRHYHAMGIPLPKHGLRPGPESSHVEGLTPFEKMKLDFALQHAKVPSNT